MNKKPLWADLHALDEDKRIEAIGKAAQTGARVGFLTDADPGKAERYIEKLKRRFPTLVVLKQMPGPVAGTITVIVEIQHKDN